MFLSSDVDISIVENNTTKKNNHNLEAFIAKLWDLGFQVGHSVRSIKDIKKIAKNDLKEFTSRNFNLTARKQIFIILMV